MNLLLHSLSGKIEGYFFSEKEISDFKIPPRKGIIDELSKNSAIKEVENIFVVSGPASFTSLRNISVFVNIFQKFSQKNLKIFSIPTKNFLEILYPEQKTHILSVGRRESFLFSEKNYKKFKNFEIENLVEEKKIDSSDIGGFFSPQVLEIFQKNFTVPAEKSPEFFLPEIEKNKNQWKVEKLEINYGAEPNIG